MTFIQRCIDVDATSLGTITQQAHDVNITSPQRRCSRCNVMALHRRDVNITSPQRRYNVITLYRRWGDVIFTSCMGSMQWQSLFSMALLRRSCDVVQSEAKSNSTKVFSHRRLMHFNVYNHLILCTIVKKILMLCNDWKGKWCMPKLYDCDKYRMSVFSETCTTI